MDKETSPFPPSPFNMCCPHTLLSMHRVLGYVLQGSMDYFTLDDELHRSSPEKMEKDDAFFVESRDKHFFEIREDTQILEVVHNRAEEDKILDSR